MIDFQQCQATSLLRVALTYNCHVFKETFVPHVGHWWKTRPRRFAVSSFAVQLVLGAETRQETELFFFSSQKTREFQETELSKVFQSGMMCFACLRLLLWLRNETEVKHWKKEIHPPKTVSNFKWEQFAFYIRLVFRDLLAISGWLVHDLQTFQKCEILTHDFPRPEAEQNQPLPLLG